MRNEYLPLMLAALMLAGCTSHPSSGDFYSHNISDELVLVMNAGDCDHLRRVVDVMVKTTYEVTSSVEALIAQARPVRERPGLDAVQADGAQCVIYEEEAGEGAAPILWQVGPEARTAPPVGYTVVHEVGDFQAFYTYRYSQ